MAEVRSSPGSSTSRDTPAGMLLDSSDQRSQFPSIVGKVSHDHESYHRSHMQAANITSAQSLDAMTTQPESHQTIPAYPRVSSNNHCSPHIRAFTKCLEAPHIPKNIHPNTTVQTPHQSHMAIPQPGLPYPVLPSSSRSKASPIQPLYTLSPLRLSNKTTIDFIKLCHNLFPDFTMQGDMIAMRTDMAENAERHLKILNSTDLMPLEYPPQEQSVSMDGMEPESDMAIKTEMHRRTLNSTDLIPPAYPSQEQSVSME